MKDNGVIPMLYSKYNNSVYAKIVFLPPTDKNYKYLMSLISYIYLRFLHIRFHPIFNLPMNYSTYFIPKHTITTELFVVRNECKTDRQSV